MRVVGVKVLKNKLSEYLRIAATGETVLVTDRDRVVAELGPPRPGRADRVSDAVLAEAVRSGWITPRLFPRGSVPPRLPVAPLETVLAGLAADREDR
jgi:antitoxin (DNA-binding transcriptional repressor) of toxin-antitoxin stability system